MDTLVYLLILAGACLVVLTVVLADPPEAGGDNPGSPPGENDPPDAP